MVIRGPWSTYRYLPQDVELFDGSVANNIGRFRCKCKTKKKFWKRRSGTRTSFDSVAARRDNATPIGELGTAISGGQRPTDKRFSARHFMEIHFWLCSMSQAQILMPTAGALTQAIMNVRARGGIVIVVAHRPSAIAGVDQVLVMRRWQAADFWRQRRGHD